MRVKLKCQTKANGTAWHRHRLLVFLALCTPRFRTEIYEDLASAR